MKKKRLLTLVGSICLVLVLVALLLPACAKEEAPVTPTPARPTPVAPSPAPTPAAPTGFEWPKTLTVMCSAVGTSDHARWCGIASIMEKSTGMKVRVIPEDIDALRPTRVFQKECDCVSQSFGEVEMGIAGIGGYSDKERLPIRIMWYGNDTGWSLAVRGDSKLTSIYDIKKGTRVAVNMASTAMQLSTKGILEGLGLTEEDVVMVPIGGYSDSIRSIGEGKADVTIFSPISSVTYEVAAAPKGLRWLDMPFEDKQLWEGILRYRCTSLPMVMSRGVKSALGKEGYDSSFVLFGLAEADQESVYHLAKWFNENFDAYKDVHANAARMSLDLFRGFLDFCSTPVAEGTIRYLKEIGKWTADDDEWNNAAIELNTKYIEAWQAAVAEAKAKGIVINYTNEEWVNLWNSYKKDFPRFKARL